MKSKKLISIIWLVFLVLAAYYIPPFIIKDVNLIDQSPDSTAEELIRSKVLRIISDEKVEDPITGGQTFIRTQTIEVKILEGKYKGKVVTAQNTISESLLFNIVVDKGDYILAFLELDEKGEISKAFVRDLIRDRYLVALGVFFVLTLLVFGGMKGFKSLVTLALTIIIILRVMFPLIIRGYSPIGVAVIASVVVTIVTLVIINGVNRKTFNAAVGTIGGVLIAGISAYIIINLSKVTGLGEDEAEMFMFIPNLASFNHRGILFAGIIMGALGAVMDIGMSIASAMNEIEKAKPDIKPKDLVKSGMNVGRDVMGTMTNTLILAYAGSSIHLILIFIIYKVNYDSIFNIDMIASEIIRALAGSIGLIFTIPITALVSGTIGRRKAIIKQDK